MNARIFALLLALLLAVPLFARDKSDVIIMKNGDHVTCEIKGLDENTLFISVDYILNTSLLIGRRLITSRARIVPLKTQDGVVYTGALSTPALPGGRPIKIQILKVSASTVDLDKTEIMKMDQTSTNFWERFNGNVGTGVTYNKGNQSTQYNLSSAVNYPRERWGASASYESTLLKYRSHSLHAQ